jgi:hypothetical protein
MWMSKAPDKARHDKFCEEMDEKPGEPKHCGCMRGRGAKPVERVKELLDALRKALDEMREAEGEAEGDAGLTALLGRLKQ